MISELYVLHLTADRERQLRRELEFQRVAAERQGESARRNTTWARRARRVLAGA
jgi:hypothetical protein